MPPCWRQAGRGHRRRELTFVSQWRNNHRADDGDDDAESVSSVEQHDEDDSDVAEIDIEDDGVEKVPRIKSGGLRKEEKHVTFVSPVKESGKERRKK